MSGPAFAMERVKGRSCRRLKDEVGVEGRMVDIATEGGMGEEKYAR